jgi:hypothetical protein
MQAQPSRQMQEQQLLLTQEQPLIKLGSRTAKQRLSELRIVSAFWHTGAVAELPAVT